MKENMEIKKVTEVPLIALTRDMEIKNFHH